jgi:hypothetical protein
MEAMLIKKSRPQIASIKHQRAILHGIPANAFGIILAKATRPDLTP